MQVAAEVLQLLEHLLAHFLEDLGGHPLANARPSHRQGRQLLSLARRGQTSGGGGANPLGRVSHRELLFSLSHSRVPQVIHRPPGGFGVGVTGGASYPQAGVGGLPRSCGVT